MDLSLVQLIKNKNWKQALDGEFSKDYFIALESFLKSEYTQGKKIFPEKDKIFEALNIVDLEKVKVVILGQDPYHGFGEAHGLSFSVPAGIRLPPSLKNILKELKDDLNTEIGSSGNLQHWAQQGVLLLNAVLTVQQDKAASHQKKGWEQLTDKIISAVSEHNHHSVFILWGSFAQKKSALIDERKHLIIKGVHPSPLSSYRGFFGSKPFSQANRWLVRQGLKPVKW